MNNRNIKVGELRNLENFQGKYFIQKLNKIIFSEMEKNTEKKNFTFMYKFICFQESLKGYISFN